MNFFALLPNLAGPDGLIIFMIILLLFGAKKLPELARGLGSAVREFSKAKDDIQSEITRPAPVAAPQIETPAYTQPHVAATETTAQPAPAPVQPTPAPAPTQHV